MGYHAQIVINYVLKRTIFTNYIVSWNEDYKKYAKNLHNYLLLLRSKLYFKYDIFNKMPVIRCYYVDYRHFLCN